MADQVIAPLRSIKITDMGQMEVTFAEFCELVADRLNALQPAFGSGSPEGVLVADEGKLYLDNDTNNFYIKKSGSGDTGWQIL